MNSPGSTPPAVRPPSVDALTKRLQANPSLASLPRPLLVKAARAGIAAAPADAEVAATEVATRESRRLLTPVINATGTLLHTNLGRAPRFSHASDHGAVRGINIELDLITGQRGSRHDAVASVLTLLTEADSGIVVNNCAAGLVLTLAAMARGRGVVVSRGELVEIGGGFRIPEIIEQSGCTLIEVGTTNRTRLRDYEQAIASHDVAVVLKVHPSNYRITGFTEEVSISSLATLGLPVIGDLGTGLLDANTPWLADASGGQPDVSWIREEPSVRGWLAEGANVVIVSGDKLLGGPQAGLVVGDATSVALCASHPLMRALRPGSLVMEGLQDTLLRYARGEARTLPFWDQATRTVDSLSVRAHLVAQAVDSPRVSASACDSTPGGGTMPEVSVPSFGVRIEGAHVDALRAWPTPIVARSADGATWCDLRTVDLLDDAVLIEALRSITTRA